MEQCSIYPSDSVQLYVVNVSGSAASGLSSRFWHQKSYTPCLTLIASMQTINHFKDVVADVAAKAVYALLVAL